MSKERSLIALAMSKVYKAFGRVVALDGVSFECHGGEVHGLVGENGAGKSTLMKILAGEYQPDQGRIFISGEPVLFRHPRQSKEMGISLIHQEFSLVPHLSVAENVVLGTEPRTRLGLIDWPALRRQVGRILDELHIELDPSRPVAELDIAQRQLVEIAKSLQADPRILIMDEPTAALERNDIEILFSLINRIKSQGRAVIFISHRLEEIFEITDRVTVLRNGRAVATFAEGEVTKDQLIEAIIGRKLEKYFPPKSSSVGEEVLRLEDFGWNGRLEGIGLSLHRGEILGLAGLEGQGQHVLLKALFGAEISGGRRGRMVCKKRAVRIDHPRDAVRLGLGYVPGDRQAEGLVLNLSLADNISLPGLYKRNFCGLINCSDEVGLAGENAARLSIKTGSTETAVANLSGGNQQKVVLAKWLASGAEVFILDEPTRGVDVGTRAEIYNLLRGLAEEGKAVIMSSRDLDEVIGLSDRVAVIHSGRIVKLYQAEDCHKQHILDIITRTHRAEAGDYDQSCG